MHFTINGLLAREAGCSPSAQASPAPKRPLKVLKFGSSVLRTTADLPNVAGEIYRQARYGDRVIAVVSALGDETDELIAIGQEVAGGVSCASLPDIVSIGEEKAAALLKIACERIGLAARLCRAEEVGIETVGEPMAAAPISLGDAFKRRSAITEEVLIVPGYVGIDVEGTRSLLGRGGSDFSAIFIAGETGADLVRLYKDVDGVYDKDPRTQGEQIHRFDEVSWADCLTLARPLLQPSAVAYAQSRKLCIEVAAIGSATPTVVSGRTLAPRPSAARRPLRLAVAGSKRLVDCLHKRLEHDPNFQIVALDCDVLVDLTSDEDIGMALCRGQLDRGADVVSANTAVLANHYRELSSVAARSGARLLYSATVGGSTPALETLARAKRHAPVRCVTAILSGTVNFLLDEIAAATPFRIALERAQERGFAEKDAADDVSGKDAARKLRIMAMALAGDQERDIAVSVEALDAPLLGRIIASGERWVQLSTLRDVDGVITGSIGFKPARRVVDIVIPEQEGNAVAVEDANGHVWTASGRGAGGWPTIEAVIADLYEIRNKQN